jgi:hypothetical protein
MSLDNPEYSWRKITVEQVSCADTSSWEKDTQLKRKMEKLRGNPKPLDWGSVPILQQGLSSHLIYWSALKRIIKPTDELYRFSTSPESWAHLAGRSGYALVRNRKVVAHIVTLMN